MMKYKNKISLKKGKELLNGIMVNRLKLGFGDSL